jgi:hypothetical protein
MATWPPHRKSIKSALHPPSLKVSTGSVTSLSWAEKHPDRSKETIYYKAFTDYSRSDSVQHCLRMHLPGQQLADHPLACIAGKEAISGHRSSVFSDFN